MLEPNNCLHLTATLVFKREGSRLRPTVWMIEQCLDCAQELDRVKVGKDYAVYSKRADK